MVTIRHGVVAAAALALSAGLACAQDAETDVGKQEYMQACASCHGESGLGQGPIAEFMNIPVPGLTRLSAENDGVFPMLDVIHVIDGRTGVRGHGGPMPIWGELFKAPLLEERGPYGSEVVVRGRILSIAYYLESIQE